MLEKTSFYPGQNSNEEIVLFIRSHWFAYLGWAAVVFIMTVMPVIVIGILIFYGAWNDIYNYNISSKFFIVTFLGAYYLFTLALFLTTWVDWYLDVTIITKGHLVIIRQDELFNRKVAEQSLLRVQDVSSQTNGIFESFFHFGTVYVETAGEQPNFKMTNIPNPTVVANTIIKLHEELAESGGEEIFEGVGMDKIKHSQSRSEKQNIQLLPKDQVRIIPAKEKVISIQDPVSKKIEISKLPIKKFNVKNKPMSSDTKKENDKLFSITTIPQKTKKNAGNNIIDNTNEEKNKNINNIKKRKRSELKEGEIIKF